MSVRSLVRAYLLRKTPKTVHAIPDGVNGEFSKVTEEYLELQDAIDQKNAPLTFVEGCDVVDATLRFQAKRFWMPGFVVFALVYLRRLYKPFRNRLYNFAGLNKADFNS